MILITNILAQDVKKKNCEENFYTLVYIILSKKALNCKLEHHDKKDYIELKKKSSNSKIPQEYTKAAEEYLDMTSNNDDK